MSIDPTIVHALEQFGAFSNQFAALVGGYFKSLIANGFTREEALTLTIQWQTSVWNTTRPPNPERKI